MCVIANPLRFWFAWTGEYNSVPWIVVTIAGVFLSTSILLVFVAYLNYITDSYLMYAASALAANTVARSACGSSAPLFTDYMFTAMGVGGGGSLIAGIGCLLAPAPFLFYKYGGAIRARSKFAPTPQKKPDDEEKAEDATERRPSGGSTTDEEERELDEEMGVPDRSELEKEIEKERSHSPQSDGNGDRFLDASGMEKAEQTPSR